MFFPNSNVWRKSLETYQLELLHVSCNWLVFQNADSKSIEPNTLVRSNKSVCNEAERWHCRWHLSLRIWRNKSQEAPTRPAFLKNFLWRKLNWKKLFILVKSWNWEGNQTSWEILPKWLHEILSLSKLIYDASSKWRIPNEKCAWYDFRYRFICLMIKFCHNIVVNDRYRYIGR